MAKKTSTVTIKLLSLFVPSILANIVFEKFCQPKRYPRTEAEKACADRGDLLTFDSGRVGHIWGDDGSENQPFVLLCHGWQSRGTTFYVIIDALVAKGHKVLAWNAPAHGSSPGYKTHVFDMCRALLEDLKQKNLTPNAFVAHSMGGAVISLLGRYIELPNPLVFISSPSQITPMFKTVFTENKLSEKVQNLVFKKINSLGDYTLDEVSLGNRKLTQEETTLVIHDRTDKEVAFGEFEYLQKVWPKAEFYPTDNLGHNRILRDEKLAAYVTAHIQKHL